MSRSFNYQSQFGPLVHHDRPPRDDKNLDTSDYAPLDGPINGPALLNALHKWKALIDHALLEI